MTREEAQEIGYCKHCAAYGPMGWRCGIILPMDHPDKGVNCIMPADAQARFRAERGLAGETQRYEKPSFGQHVLPRRTIKKRRKFS